MMNCDTDKRRTLGKRDIGMIEFNGSIRENKRFGILFIHDFDNFGTHHSTEEQESKSGDPTSIL